VLTVWQPIAGLGTFAWTGATAGGADFVELDRQVAEDGARMAVEGVRIAQAAGLQAKPLAAQATGPVWKTIIEIADGHQAAMIVMGSRGLSGLRLMLLGSVSSAVVHHADQPTLVIHRSSDGAGEE
jgi:nucleotide-binding universal stress UspA family protein